MTESQQILVIFSVIGAINAILWAPMFIGIYRDKIRELSTDACIYEVVDTGYSKLIITEGFDNVPVGCESEIVQKCEQFIKFNPSKTLYIKAKIDPETYEVLKVEGYKLESKATKDNRAGEVLQMESVYDNDGKRFEFWRKEEKKL